VPESVRITDVSPRDGLQNEAGVIPTADKVRLVELLSETGVDEVEVTSFVSAKWVPQLGDARDVLKGCLNSREIQVAMASEGGRPSWKSRSPMLSALVPNLKGFEDLQRFAEEEGQWTVEKVSVFTAASEEFNRRNINASIAESIERFRPVLERAHSHRLIVRGYISCVIACPFTGAVKPSKVIEVAHQLLEVGVDEIDLGDTIGAGTADSIRDLLAEYLREVPVRSSQLPVTLHLHDTFGRAADCVRTALDLGVRSFDGSVAGLGGCPYASTPGKRAPGNIATETLVRTVHETGYVTGVDMDALARAGAFAREIVERSRAESSS